MEGMQHMYQKQQKIAFAQFLVDLPNFIVVLVFAVLSESMIVWVDVLDSMGYVMRSMMVMLMGRKLLRDLRFEYNYGSGKIESMIALLCDGIIFGGLIIMMGVCFYDLRHPDMPGDIVLAAVLMKVVNVSMDVAFLWAQRKVMKENNGAIAKSAYASYLGALLFDGTAMVSLVIAWLLRNNPISWYFSPAVGILLAVYLMYKCIGRIRAVIHELTDKTLPEEMQMKILKVMTGHFDQYAQLHFVKSHRFGDRVAIDLLISFQEDTSFAQILQLKKQVQEELSKLIENCEVNLNIC